VAAEALFQEAKDLAAAGQWAPAAEKFAQSFQLDRASGPLYNLANCHEQLGKTATAWAEFREVVSLATTEGKKERAEAANDRAKALEPKLVRVQLAVDDKTPGLTVTRNGKAVEPLTWGVAVPVDPGEYVFEATAPGKSAWRTTVRADVAGKALTVRVPVLGEVVAVAVVEPTVPKPPFLVRQRGSLITLGVGAALAGVGAGLGGAALASHAKVTEACKGLGGMPCDQLDDARAKAIGSSVMFGAAGAAGVTAVVLFVMGEAKSKPPAAVGPATGMPVGVAFRF
jgi:hypothetical protein